MKLYGIFYTDRETGKALWAMERSKRRALQFAQLHYGYVTVMNDDPATRVWDRTTFIACSTQIADYRSDYHVGDRIRIHPASDWFMRGAIYATVTAVPNATHPNYRVQLENIAPVKRVWLSPANILDRA